ncbi:MAG: 3-dehydroquinate synthase [Verrucomicrobia bacterium]|nr:3-dehydroquinate synthase [Verrucomicrobiota bacterium]
MQLSVRTSRHSYFIVVEEGALDRLGAELRRARPEAGRSVALVTDSHVGPLHAARAEAALRAADFAVTTQTVPAGENSKSLEQAGALCEAFAAAGLDRHSTIVALGGGVIGDLAGFAAAIYHRGLAVVQVPTTIVAQVDSAIGGKTGVNLAAGKNLVGAFHPPVLVLTDPALLATLPRRAWCEGFAEVIKHGVIADRAMVEELAAAEPRDLTALVSRNAAIKARIVQADEFERGERMHLNFGHTVGHAIEAAAGYGGLLHGEAVALGSVVAARLSVRNAALPAEDEALLHAALRRFELPLRLEGAAAEVGDDALLELLRRDKKFKDGRIRFVLTRRLGSAFVSEDVTEDDIRAALAAVR